MKKPKGIKILAIILIVLSGLGLLGLLQSLIFSAIGMRFGQYYLSKGIINLIVMTAFLVGAVGLMKYKEWGRKLLIISSIVFILMGLIYVIFFPSAAGINILVAPINIISSVLYLILVVYLFTPKVKKACS